MATNIKFKRTSTTTLPTGLTFAEPAFVLGSAGTTTANQLYVGDNSGGRVWVGAKIENTVTSWTGTEANTLLATQQAIDARITSRITSSGGFTFAATSGTPQTLTPGDTITIAAGSGISTTAGATDTVTVANTGVLSFNSSTGAVTGVGSFNGLTGTVTGVSSNIAGSGISVSGATGNVTITNTGVTGIQAGTAISVSANTGNVTVTNTGVQSLSINALSGIQALTVSGTTGAITYTISNTGVTGIQAGTGISVSSATGYPTITNTGVQSIAGTSNQITASGSTGAVTLSLPSAVTMPGSLTVTGDLTVNGTTTTVNSTVVQVQDPIIAIGGYTGGTPPTVGDVKDRGIAFQWYSGAGLTGFFGHDTSANAFTYIASGATLASEVVSGTPGKAIFGTVDIYSATGNATLSYSGSAATFTLPNHASGTLLAPSTLGTSNYILKSNGVASQPSWQDPTAAGFTAFTATNVSGGAQGSLHYQTAANTTGMLSLGTANYLLTAGSTAPQWTNPNAAGFTSYVSTNVVTTEQSTGTYYLTFTTGAANAAALSVDATATTALSYNVATGTLACAVIDALVDGGAY
jgi:hypothetical protein